MVLAKPLDVKVGTIPYLAGCICMSCLNLTFNPLIKGAWSDFSEFFKFFEIFILDESYFLHDLGEILQLNCDFWKIVVKILLIATMKLT